MKNSKSSFHDDRETANVWYATYISAWKLSAYLVIISDALNFSITIVTMYWQVFNQSILTPLILISWEPHDDYSSTVWAMNMLIR